MDGQDQPQDVTGVAAFPFPENEAGRLEALETYGLLGTPTEPAFDDIAELVAQLCRCSVGYVTLVGDTHDWLKGQYGFPTPDWFEPMPRHSICCATTICGSDLLVVSDLTEDLRFCDLPYVTEPPHVRFYAGMPLINSDGYALGTLCVLDFQRREFGLAEREIMRRVSRQVIAQLELRRTIRQLAAAQRELAAEQRRSDALLANILPSSVADELKRHHHVQPRYFESVTIMFADFKDFTLRAERMEPRRLVDELDFYFSAFDDIVARHNLEKLKTIGDAYMCVGGLPQENATHATDACLAAREIQAFMTRTNHQRGKMRLAPWETRIGIHTGGVMAGVVGRTKFAYDVWGDAVNLAARMEECGKEGRVNISETTYARVKEHFETEPRGSIQTKNHGFVEMYFLKGETTADAGAPDNPPG